jgi:hypothetical protein
MYAKNSAAVVTIQKRLHGRLPKLAGDRIWLIAAE